MFVVTLFLCMYEFLFVSTMMPAEQSGGVRQEMSTSHYFTVGFCGNLAAIGQKKSGVICRGHLVVIS